MYKKALLIGIVTTLMCSTTFASPWRCLRSKLHTDLGVDINTIMSYDQLNKTKIPKYKHVTYSDYQSGLTHPFEFANLVRNDDIDNYLFNLASTCHCTVGISNEAWNYSYVRGWCWDV